MSKEEVLLEVVLDNFSNILEVLNATKDIEVFLVKLKLKKKRGIGVILEKTKNLVDSLYNHSVKVKDEFYKHYNMLDNIPSEEEKSNEDNDSTIESNIVDVTNGQNISEEDGTKESSEKTPGTNETASENNIAEDDISNDTGNMRKDVLESTSVENEITDSNSPDSPKNNIEDDDTMEKTNDLCGSIAEDPLKDVEVPDKNDTNQLDNDKENVDSEKNCSLAAEDKVCENTEENKERKSLIRLVDLSKLIDPKPKKTVKFDSSVIILTSSDEEGNSPNKNSKDQNCILKSMLINSKSDKTDSCISKRKNKDIKENDGKESHKNRRYNRSTRNKRNDSNSHHSEETSSDNDVLNDSKREKLKKSESSRGKEIEKKRNFPNNNESSDSDVVEVCLESVSKTDNKKTKAKQNSKNYDTSSDSEDSDEKSIKKTKKQKEKPKINHNSDSDKNSDVSDSDCDQHKGKSKKSVDDDYSNNSRRSSRISTKKDIKEKTREKLKTIFKRKSSRSGKSNFEIINDKSKDSEGNDSDSASESTKKRKKSQRRKDILEQKLTLSSSTEDETEDLKINKNHKKKKNTKVDASSVTPSVDDIKLTYKVYIPLPRIECSQLKEIYLTNKEILEIKRLTNLKSLRKTKRSHATKNVSNSSSDTEKPRRKRSKKKSKSSSSSDQEQTSADESCEKVTEVSAKKKFDQEAQNEDQIMADIVMDELKQSEVEVGKPAEDDSSASEEEEKQTSKKNNKKDEKIKSSDDENKKEDSKDEDSSTDEKKKESKDKHTSDDENEKDSDKDKEPTDDKTEKEDENKSSNDEEKSDNSDEEKRKVKKKWRKDKLLTAKIDSTDSEEELNKYRKKKENSKEEKSDTEVKSPIIKKRKTKKRVKKTLVISDSDSDSGKKKDKGSGSDEDSSDEEKSSSSNESEPEEVPKKKPRSRIKRTNDSSSDDDDKSTRKQIRRVIGKDALSDSTKQAEAEEKERKARIAEKQKKYNSIFEIKADSKVKKVVLDYDEDKKEELLCVNKKIVKKLKPHQGSGVQFMWDACFESLKRAQTTKGSGCILAHCMGLGKTLQVIALTHCLLTNSDKTLVNRVMVVCPINTVLNWKAEFKQWLPKEDDFEVYELVSCKQNYERQYIVQEWHNDGGVLIIGYQMFRNLSNPDNKRLSKKMRASFKQGLVDPGPDLVVCDEGHLLKNEKTHLSIAMNRIKTARRIVLTGTPLQNNLKEYWCMVQFIKPNLLGTYKEYLNRFVNPIINGQYTDSTQHDILLMRKRSHVLHKLLDGVVQRRDYAVLEPYLPPKHEYVLFVQLTEVQVKLYEYYMEKLARKNDGSNRTSFLFTDFQQLQRICTHPRVLLDKSNEKREKFDDEEESEGSLKDFIDDGDESSSDSSKSSSSKSSDNSDDSSSDKKKSKSQKRVRITRSLAAQKRDNNEESDSELEEIKKEWWQEFCDGEELDNINNSGKLFLLFQILKECEEIGDKVLVFSQSLYTLNCIEYFLEKIDEATQNGNTEKVGGHTGSWAIGLDYFRLDGSSSCDNRATWCDMFNNPDNIRARLFLISTKAGGLGINLVAANRVIIFDVSWNPSHDIQSIYRVYRFGQTKPCYIYRFVAYGTMEMKIYERQVTKQAISKRVIDEQQIDRHYNQNDLQELYKCDLQPTERPIPLVPKDVLLGEMLQKYDKTIYKYHLHQSLLENKEAEGLNEEERKAAWEEFENEKVLRKNTFNTGVSNNSVMNAQAIEAALTNIVRKDNPTWSEVQVKGIIPALVQQLRVQLSEGDMTMYTRVQQEMQIMQAQAQRLKEAYFQQQVMRMIQHQQEQAKMLGNMNVDPVQLARAQANMFGNLLGPRQGSSSSQPQRPVSNDVIELND